MYDHYIKINKKFKSSVNLQYDLGNTDKLLQYIPTTDLCDVIKSYAKSVLFGDTGRSTLLAGPYGKGKSYLMLVITYLFSKREDRVAFEALLEKISSVDAELADYLRAIDDRSIALLPVIINNNDSDDINQNFMLALRNSLKNVGIENIIPNSVFSECLKQIEIWENSADLNLLTLCEEKYKVNLTSLKNGLKDFSKEAYEKFSSLFECINHGYKFNALVGNDISNIYQSVTNSIQSHGYKGLFVIFDEFGVFLENKTSDFAVKLNKIQAFAERCNSSSNEAPMYFCCITHKDISLYQNDKTFSDDFEKISGRFKQIRFDRTLDENYQILCNAIEKSKGYKALVNRMRADYQCLYNVISGSGIFSSDDQLNHVTNFGFPFNPIALYVLIQVSEKIAQNERTLFTFISDSDLYSFRYFIANNEHGLLNVDYIYDYFQGLIKNNPEYKSLYFKVDSLSKIDLKKEHHDIFKCIALMKIINDDIKYSATIANIAISLGKDEQSIREAIEELISANILKRSVANNTIDFDVLADNELSKLIESVITSKISYESESELLSRFDTDRYVVSNKYNFEFSMTRFFYTVYLNSSELKHLKSFNILLKESKADGIIINLINNDASTVEDIIDVLNNDESHEAFRVIVRLNPKKISEDVLYKLRRIYASVALLEGKNNLSEPAKEALRISIDDISSELNEYLKDYHLHSVCLNKTDFSTRSLKEIAYKALVRSFPSTIIFNNEQVNKNTLSAVTTKARNNVIDNILCITNNEYSPTSAEGTILASFEESIKSCGEMIVNLQKLIIDSKKRLCAAELVNYLSEYPFGMRKGVIPLFIAKVVSMLNVFDRNDVQTVLLYNNTKQIKMDASNLTKVMNSPIQYFISFKKVNKDRIHFIESLANSFGVHITHNFNEDAESVVKALRSYASNLEPVIVKSSPQDNILNLSSDEIKFKDLFLRHDLSTFDILCDELNCFGNNSAEILGNLLLIKNAYKEKVARLYEASINKLKQELSNLTEESVKTNYVKWKNDNPNVLNIIFDNENKKIFNAFESAQYNDFEVIDKLSFAILNCTLNDWNCKKQEQFFKAIQEFISFVHNWQGQQTLTKEDIDISSEVATLSRLGMTLYTNLQEMLDEYGSSLTNSEKANILRKLLKDIIN